MVQRSSNGDDGHSYTGDCRYRGGDRLVDYLKRILYVLNHSLQKKIKDGFTKGWQYKASRRVVCGVEIALTVPIDSSYDDAQKNLPALVATCGKEVELEDYKGVLVVRIIEKDWPDSRKLFNPKHIRKDKLLMGYNRMLEPVYHPLNVHILEGGAAGSGKTDWQRWIIYQLLLQGYTVFVCDLKSYSFFPFEGLLTIATDLNQSLNVLKFAVNEMQKRKETVMKHRSRVIIKTFKPIVIMIDEAASLSPSQYGGKEKAIAKECDQYIALLGQQSREPKIFVIYGTQRPDMNIINKQFKANVEASIAFRTKDHFNSQIIIDRKGAELISPKTPGRCIYSHGTDTLLQVPYIGGDDEWTELLKPLKEGRAHGNASQSANQERQHPDGTIPRSDSDNAADRKVIPIQQFAAKKGQPEPRGVGESEAGGMGMAPEIKDMDTHQKRPGDDGKYDDEI